jgi:hypothetical protein
MHAMTACKDGRKTTRCGLTVPPDQATGWESEVTCPDCEQERTPVLH